MGVDSSVEEIEHKQIDYNSHMKKKIIEKIVEWEYKTVQSLWETMLTASYKVKHTHTAL